MSPMLAQKRLILHHREVNERFILLSIVHESGAINVMQLCQCVTDAAGLTTTNTAGQMLIYNRILMQIYPLNELCQVKYMPWKSETCNHIKVHNHILSGFDFKCLLMLHNFTLSVQQHQRQFYLELMKISTSSKKNLEQMIRVIIHISLEANFGILPKTSGSNTIKSSPLRICKLISIRLSSLWQSFLK